jgi:hypothetical protein
MNAAAAGIERMAQDGHFAGRTASIRFGIEEGHFEKIGMFIEIVLYHS